MPAFGFDKKDKVEREESLEPLTAGFKLDFQVVYPFEISSPLI